MRRRNLEAVGVRTNLRGLHHRDLIEHSANSHVNVSVAGGHSRAQSIGQGAKKSAHETGVGYRGFSAIGIGGARTPRCKKGPFRLLAEA